uniref:Uncharacterized protein n=1 Tax=Arundo donax TaxID=35708 RepID=A0A0A9HGH3_ARUDO
MLYYSISNFYRIDFYTTQYHCSPYSSKNFCFILKSEYGSS